MDLVTGTLDRSADDIPRHIRLLHIGRNASAYDILRGATNTLRRARIDLVHVSGDEGLRHRSAIVAFLACVGYQSIPSADREGAPTESTEANEEPIFAVHERLLPDMSGTWPESAEDRLSRYCISPDDVVDLGAADQLEAVPADIGNRPAVRIAADATSALLLDERLEEKGLYRVHTAPPNEDGTSHITFVKRPPITCGSIGSLGRFGNHLFQYLFLQCYADDYGMNALNLPWAGDAIFNVAPGVDALPVLPHRFKEQSNVFEKSKLIHATGLHPATDFEGFFQYDTQYYRPHRAMIREQLAFKGAYRDRADQVQALFDAQDGPVAALHLRRGDYGYNIFFIAPEAWYLTWLETIADSKPTIYIASDDLELVLPAFEGWPVISERDLPPTDLPHGYFTDFVALSLADHVAISNSSFSFAASLLNTGARTFMRPSLPKRALIPYDPWNAPVLLRDMMAEDGPEGTFRTIEVKPKSLRKRLKKFFGRQK
ncbi:MAG: hypothetical protein HKP35_04605 [Silicimonas sp.]|nr:hypothetical protein [Silicimonas sp.]